jgi:hypothetical protein
MDNINQALQTMPLDQVINWSAVSKQKLSETFIDCNHEYLDWRVVSATQPLAPWLVDKYKDKIDFNSLSSNKQLSPETVAAFIDKMDIDLSQANHRYTDEMILAWQEDLNPMILIQHQKLSSSTVAKLMQQYIESQQWQNVKLIANAASQYQVMDKNFYDELLKLERDTNELLLFDRSTVLRYQRVLPEQWVLENLVMQDLMLRRVMLENFPCSDLTILTSMVNNPEIVNYRKILKKQKIRESVLYYILELNTENAPDLVQIIFQNQNYDADFMQKILRDYVTDPDQVSRAYNMIFLRTLKPQSPNYISWSHATLLQTVLPNLGLDTLAVTDLQDYIPEFVEALCKFADSFRDFSYYKFVSSNSLNDDTLKLLEPLLNCLEYWYAFTKNKNNLSKTYILNNENKLKWWCQVPAALLLDFSQRCLTCSESSDTYGLIKAFVFQTKWTEFLSTETLPEWVIEVFARFRLDIERQLNSVSFWWKIGRHQRLSPEFIDVHSKDLDLKNILIYQQLTLKQLNHFREFFDDDCCYYVEKYQHIPLHLIESLCSLTYV